MADQAKQEEPKAAAKVVEKETLQPKIVGEEAVNEEESQEKGKPLFKTAQKPGEPERIVYDLVDKKEEQKEEEQK